MIIVKIELHSARTGQVTQLGEMRLSNNNQTSREKPTHGSYRVEVFRKPKFDKVTRDTEVEDSTLIEEWPRKSKVVWQLIQKALNQLYP